MSLIDRANEAKDTPEPQSQPDGQYKLSIVSLKDDESGDNSNNPGAKFTRVTIRIETPSNPPAKLISETFMHDTSVYEENVQEMMALKLKGFMTAFKVTPKELVPDNYDKLKGKEAWAVLNEKDDTEYGTQNNIKRYITAE
ncbi:MAG: hypothetical protein GY804_00950 [Alphaproteobacteria bacterium]|nr:hypothetical protein [Alphaproteobacteria bacterium]